MVFVQGSAENIPLADGVTDLVFLSMVYHHLQGKGQAVCEFKRVLKAGGLLCIRTSTQESMDSYLWLRFFPGAREIELGRAPSRKGMTDFLQGHGFAPQGHTIVRQLFAENRVFHKSFRGVVQLRQRASREHGPASEGTNCGPKSSAWTLTTLL
jgi:ubiquinone/menaquinone biosynthesis C-methylase UbiE